MSAVHTTRPRLLRPHLSLRYQCLRRAESTTTLPPPPPPPNFFRRNRSPLLWATLGLTLGWMGGNMAMHIVAPPPMPEAGSHEDRMLMADLNQRMDAEFKVKIMRGKCLGVAKQLKGSSEAGWVEIVRPLGGEGKQADDGGEGLVAQMQGAKGLGAERLFWNREEQKLVAVVWFGAALSGWPGVAHGGVIATALTEKTALAAALAQGMGGDSKSAAATPQRLPGTGSHAKMLAPAVQPDEPAQLSLSYVKPTHANRFYVIRVSPSIDLEDDPQHIVPAEPTGGHEYEATLETPEGQICVKAKAKFAPSSALRRAEDEVMGLAKSGYAEFKKTLWPSRQASTQTG
ncbi:hypothetical protein LTR53_008708 [Teratosphaeriaceae sp. CCFEE 6253]|nr:hypothetical protein LTR53_008708 [Teratosphaeriaceae sp. CCFEE 6253]